MDQIIKLITKTEHDSKEKSSDLKKSKVYIKLCETKIKSLETELSKYFKVDIQDELVDLITSNLKNGSGSFSQAPIICKLYPNSDFFEDTSKIKKKIELAGELKINESEEAEYMTQQRPFSMMSNKRYRYIKIYYFRSLSN